MFTTKRAAVGGGIGCGTGLVLLTLATLTGGLALEYVVEAWTAFFGNPVDVPFPHLATILAGMVLSQFVVPMAIVTWLLMLVL